MFKFSFGFRRATKKLRIPKEVHVLQECELESFVGGRTPVQQLLHPVDMPDWVRSTSNGVGSYSRYPSPFPASPWAAMFAQRSNKYDKIGDGFSLV